MIHSVKRATEVINRLVRAEGEIKFGKLAKDLSIPPSTLHRTLATLEEVGWVKHSRGSKDGTYSIGDELILTSLSVTRRSGLSEISRPYLKKLTEKTGESSNLVVLGSNKKEVIYVEQVEGDSLVRGLSLIGSRAPVHATGVGKVLLAGMDWSEVKNNLEEPDLVSLTENTITDFSKLKSELEEVSESGYAVDKEECERGAACIAVPVRDGCDNVVAAMSVSGPVARILSEELPELVSATKEQGRELSRNLEYEL